MIFRRKFKNRQNSLNGEIIKRLEIEQEILRNRHLKRNLFLDNSILERRLKLY